MKSKIFAISAIGLATLSLMTAHANPILPRDHLRPRKQSSAVV
jgi:hypothetical protein